MEAGNFPYLVTYHVHGPPDCQPLPYGLPGTGPRQLALQPAQSARAFGCVVPSQSRTQKKGNYKVIRNDDYARPTGVQLQEPTWKFNLCTPLFAFRRQAADANHVIVG